MLESVTEVYHHPLQIASSAGDHCLLQQLLNDGFQSNIQNFDRVTPLHEAAINGHVECVKLLIDHGARVSEYYVYAILVLRNKERMKEEEDRRERERK